MLRALEDRHLYRGTKASDGWVPPPDGLPVEELTLTSADGDAIHAWWVAPDGWKPADGAIHYSHGNGGNLSHRGGTLAGYRKFGYAVLIYDYPGYGKSGGRPTEAGLYAAGEAAHRWLTETKGVPSERVILYGGSLGGAVATELATRHPCRALVLAAAFTSVPDMAQRQFWFLPARWFVRTRMDNLAKLATLACPVFVTHGTADRVVPFAMGERLVAAARGPKFFLPAPGRDHHDVIGPEFFPALAAFLSRDGS